MPLSDANTNGGSKDDVAVQSLNNPTFNIAAAGFILILASGFMFLTGWQYRATIASKLGLTATSFSTNYQELVSVGITVFFGTWQMMLITATGFSAIILFRKIDSSTKKANGVRSVASAILAAVSVTLMLHTGHISAIDTLSHNKKVASAGCETCFIFHQDVGPDVIGIPIWREANFIFVQTKDEIKMIELSKSEYPRSLYPDRIYKTNQMLPR